MNQATFYFHAELKDFLPSPHQPDGIACAFKGRPAAKHLIEALGIPHTEVASLLANATPVPLSYPVQDGDRLDVYPASLVPQDTTGASPAFILDVHLGKLAVYLRMLGFDTLYRNDYTDAEIARLAAAEDRVVLTRDRRLLMRRIIRRGYWVRALEPDIQLPEVLHRFQLKDSFRPFRRCLRCNHPLQAVSKEAVLPRLEPLTRRYYDEFHICPACNQIYWKGSHYQHMAARIRSLMVR